MDNRKIDKLITRKILNWEAKYSAFRDKDGTVIHRSEFKPSTNIQHAWIIVEEMRKTSDRLYGFELEDGYEKEYQCCFYGKARSYTAEANTASLAICLSALKTIGIEINDEENVQSENFNHPL